MSQRGEKQIEIIDVENDCPESVCLLNQEEESEIPQQDTQALLDSEPSGDEKSRRNENDDSEDEQIRKRTSKKKMRFETSDEEDDEDIPKNLKICPKHEDNTYKCGEHFHIDEGHALVCNNTPWGRILLSEAKMSRREITIKRFHNSLAKPYFNIHNMMVLFHKHNMDLLKPVETKLPRDIVYTILQRPDFFNYQCLTVCDCELLRNLILHFFGIVKSIDENGDILISLKQINKNVNRGYKIFMDTQIHALSEESTNNFMEEHQIEPWCSSCFNKRKQICLYSKEILKSELISPDDNEVANYI